MTAKYTNVYLSVAMRAYALKDVCSKIGLPSRTVIDWAEKQVVRPQLADTTGSGKPRQYSHVNLLEFMIAKELVALGISVRRVKRLLDLVREEAPRFWNDVDMIALAQTRQGKLRLAGAASAIERGKAWAALAKDVTGRTGRREGEATFVVLDIDAYRNRLAES